MKINKIMIAVAVALTTVVNSFAQEVQYGVKAGYNLSTLSGAPEGVNVESRSGFHVGGLADIQLTERFSLQPELLYSTEGAKSSFSFEEEDFAVNASEELKLGYLNLPIMAKFYVVDGLSLQAGPQVGYLLSAKSDYDYSAEMMGEVERESGTEDIKEEAKKFAFGLNFGLGYDLNRNFFLQARYHLGLTGITDNEISDEEPTVEMDDIKNSGFQFSLGYKF